MPKVELSAGPIEYDDTGGNGQVAVLVPGLAMDASVYRHVVPKLRHDFRCIVPTLPLGSHRTPMNEDADLSPRGISKLEGEFLEALDLHDVTLVGNDSGLFLFTAASHEDRIARLVITACEAFDNFPPGLPGKNLAMTAKTPGAMTMAAMGMRVRAMRHTPIALGPMASKRVPDDMTDRWFGPLVHDRAVRRDLKKYLKSARKGDMMEACEGLRGFAKPTLVIWGRDDRMMPPEHGRRFAELVPDARLVELDDCKTLIQLDQPEAFARHVRDFVFSTAPEHERSNPAG